MGLICESYVSCWCRKEGVSYANLLVCSASFTGSQEKVYAHIAHTGALSDWMSRCKNGGRPVCDQEVFCPPHTHTSSSVHQHHPPSPRAVAARGVVISKREC